MQVQDIAHFKSGL